MFSIKPIEELAQIAYMAQERIKALEATNRNIGHGDRFKNFIALEKARMEAEEAVTVLRQVIKDRKL